MSSVQAACLSVTHCLQMADDSWLFLPVGDSEGSADWMVLEPGPDRGRALHTEVSDVPQERPQVEPHHPERPHEHHKRQVHLELATALMASGKAASAAASPADPTSSAGLPGTVYNRNCADVQRIGKVLRAGCSCSFQCRKNMPQKTLEEFCKVWSSLTDEEQGQVLKVSYSNANSCDVETEDMRRLVTQWYLCGTRVSVECLISMLGTTAKTFFKKCQGVADRRKFPRLHHVSDSSSQIVDQFFSELYLSCTEDLPEMVSVHLCVEFCLTCVGARYVFTPWGLKSSVRASFGNWFPGSTWPQDGARSSWGMARPSSESSWSIDMLGVRDVDKSIQMDSVQHCSAATRAFVEDGLLPDWSPFDHAADTLAALTAGGSDLKPRYMQHAHLRDVYWQFVAWWESLPWLAGPGGGTRQPSWATFWRRWDAKWKKIIRFRKSSQHSQCVICFECASFLHRSKADAAEKMKVAKEWRDHLSAQYADRLIYWHMRWSSRLRVSGVLVCIIDGMDKSKFSWPQFPFILPKGLDKEHRPRLCITGAIAHGFVTSLYVAHDESSPHGASQFCDILCRTITKVFQICKANSWRRPEQLVVQADNTTASAKNAEVLLFLASLVARNKFSCVVSNFLTVGHTHEDIDALFSLVLSKVLKPCAFGTPQELIREMRTRLGPHFNERQSVESFTAELHTHVFDFKAWLSDTGVELRGAFKRREGIDAAHSFTLKKVSELAGSEKSQLSAGDLSRSHDQDVYVMTKRWMHSVEAHPPTLVLPHARCRLLRSGGPTKEKKGPVMSLERKTDLRKMGDKLESLTDAWTSEFSMYRVAAELRRLAEGIKGEPCDMPWLWEPESDSSLGHLPETGNRFFNSQPEMAWRVVAKFLDVAPAPAASGVS